MTRSRKSQLDPVIRHVGIGKLTIHHITDSELESLRRGSPESLFLNLGIAVFSIAVSFTIALATTTIDSIKTYCFFVILAVVGYLASATFGMLWWRSRGSVKSVIQEIMSRSTPEGIQEVTEGEGSTSLQQEGDVES
jgi:hypothetical protein